MILDSIQYLRGVAALMVVVFHLLPQLHRMGYEGYWPDWLAGGVDIFFVISGFIMWLTTAGTSVSAGAFYAKRIVRIVPLYWLLTSVAVAVLLAAPQLLQSTTYDSWHVLASYLFIPAVRPGTDDINPVLHPGWTLNLEMFFYLLFGLALQLPERLRLAAMTAALGGLVCLGWLVQPSQPPAGNVYLAFFTLDILLEFLAGMYLGKLYLSGRLPASRGAGWALAIAGFAMMALLLETWPGHSRLLVLGLPAVCIVLGALMLERSGSVPRLSWPLLLGDASYSIYLSHSMTLSAMGQAWRRLGGAQLPGGLALFCLAGLAVAILAGLATYRIAEQPATRYFKRRLTRSPSPARMPGTSGQTHG